MTRLKLAYISRYADRHGKIRHYFKRPGQKQIPLPGLPGSKEFMAAYQAALGDAPAAIQPGRGRYKPYTFHALITHYYQSTKFRDLKASSQKAYREVIEQFREKELKPGDSASGKYGDIDVRLFRPKDISKIIESMHDTPARAGHLLSRLKSLFRLAIKLEWRDTNPAVDIDKPKRKKGGIPPWTEEEIAAYEAYWPSGSRQRLALALMLYTGQRRSDIHVMGKQHLSGGRILVKQLKTDARLAIRIHSKLQVELDQVTHNELTFVLTEYGKPFSAAGFSIWVNKMAKAAGVPNRSPHGLRKAAARRLAEAECTTKQIMAITGHQTLSEVEKYMRDTNQKRMGDDAIERLERTETGT